MNVGSITMIQMSHTKMHTITLMNMSHIYKNAYYHLHEYVAVCTCMMSAKAFMISLSTVLQTNVAISI